MAAIAHVMIRAASGTRTAGGIVRGGRRQSYESEARVSESDSPLSTTVGGLAVAAGVEPHVIRYYVRIGLLTPARDPNNGYKRFTGHDLAHLRFIRGAQALGYTLAEIRRILHHAAHGRSPCPEVREILQQRVMETRERLRGLQELQQRMERALHGWKNMKDGIPDGHSVCVLIESTLSLIPRQVRKRRMDVQSRAAAKGPGR